MKDKKKGSEIECIDEIGLDYDHERIVEEVFGRVKQILSYLPRSIPGYTDHGVQHSNNLMRIFSNFVQNLSNFENVSLYEEEKWLVCLATWVHDIGCLVVKETKKSEHNRASLELLDGKEFDFLIDLLGKDIFTCLKLVVVSHSSNYDETKLPNTPIHPRIRLELICAIFRLLDGCDITSARTKRILLNILKSRNLLNSKHLKHWEAHANISSVVFQKNHIVIDCDELNISGFLIGHLRTELRKMNQILKKYRFPEFGIKVTSLKNLMMAKKKSLH